MDCLERSVSILANFSCSKRLSTEATVLGIFCLVKLLPGNLDKGGQQTFMDTATNLDLGHRLKASPPTGTIGKISLSFLPPRPGVCPEAPFAAAIAIPRFWTLPPRLTHKRPRV